MDGAFELLANEELYERVVKEALLGAERTVDLATATLKEMLVEVSPGAFRGLADVLADLCFRGVEVRLLHASVPSGPFLADLKRAELARSERFGMRRCPRVHLKAVVVDGTGLYLGSANLTGAGLGAKGANRRNFEIGLWTGLDAVRDRVMDLFEAIWHGRACPACRLKDTDACPVPLEAPAF